MTSRRRPVSLSIVVISIMMLLSGLLASVSIDGSEEMTSEEIDNKFPILEIIEDVDIRTTNYVLNGRVADWHGDTLYIGYILNDQETGKVSAKLVASPDGGLTWEEPVTIYELVDCYFARIDILIHEGSLFYFYQISWELEWETWELYSVNVPVEDWKNISDRPSVRMDNEHEGFMSFSQAMVFNGEVHLFWIRSHYIHCLYRVYKGGEWTPIRFVEADSLISNFAAISSDITGTETLYLFFMHHPTYRLYLTTSTDGINWTPAEVLFYMEDKPSKVDVVENHGRLHVVVDERNGYDIYHSYTTDGSSFSEFKIVGEHTINALSGASYPANVALASPEESGTIYFSYEYDDGVVLKTSEDNGDSFHEVCRFKNDTAYYPVFDHQARLLLINVDMQDLQIRSLQGAADIVPDPEDPGDDDNQTDPDDPGDDDNQTDPDDPGDDDNQTDPDDPGDDDNQTDPQDPEPPSEPSIIPENEQMEAGGVLLKADIGGSGDYDKESLSFHWILDNEVIGYGESFILDRPEGEYNITLRIYYTESDYIEAFSIVSVGGAPAEESSPLPSYIYIMPIAVAFLVLLTLISLVFAIRKRKKTIIPIKDGIREREASYRKRAPSIAPVPPAPTGIRAGSLHDGQLDPAGGELDSYRSIEGAQIDISSIPDESGITIDDLRSIVLEKDIIEDIGIRKKALRKKARQLRSQKSISDESASAIENIMDNIDA